MRGEVYKIKVDTRDELLGGSFDAAAAHIRKAKINSAEKHTIFPQELQNALRLAVGFWNSYYEL